MAVFTRIVASVLLGALVAAAQNAVPAAIDWLPDGAIYTLRIDQPAPILEVAYILDLPSAPGGKALQTLVDTLAKRAGTDATGLVRNLSGGGITFAMYPGDNSVWVFDAQDAQVLDQLQQFVKILSGTEHQASPASAAFYQEYPCNVVAWSLDGKQFFARTGNRLVLASRGDALKALFTPHPNSSLGSSPLYAKARRALSPQGAAAPAAWAFADMAALTKYPPIQKALTLGAEPMAVLLNGPWKQSLRDACWIAIGLTVAQNGDGAGHKIRFHLVTDGKLTATLAGAFALPSPNQGILPNLTVPGELAAATLWRDLGKFYAQKETFFPLKTSAGILAENFMEIFFTGRNLTDDVFNKFHPQVRLVVARQQFDPALGTPDEQYPAAALVFRTDLQSSADFGEVMEEAWQKAIGLTNFTRGQAAQPGLILDRQTHGGVTFTFGAFPVRGEKDRAHLPSRFNARPSIVRDGPYLILSTTDALARDLIDVVNQEDVRTTAAASDVHTLFELTSPAGIAALLKLNKPARVRESVLESGKKPEQAAKDFDRNVAWLDKLNRARLSISSSQADLELELR